jgi:hypothetical protein
LQTQNGIKTDIVRCITSDKGHICMVINNNDHFYQRVDLTKTARAIFFVMQITCDTPCWYLTFGGIYVILPVLDS